MKLFEFFFALISFGCAFIICVLGAIFTLYGAIAHGLKNETAHALTCSWSCALYILLLLILCAVIKNKSRRNEN